MAEIQQHRESVASVSIDAKQFVDLDHDGPCLHQPVLSNKVLERKALLYIKAISQCPYRPSNPALQSLRPLLGNIQCLLLKRRLRCDMAALFHHLLLYCSPMASRTEPQISAEIQNWQIVLLQHHMQEVGDKWTQLICRPTGSNPSSPIQPRSAVASGSLAVLVPSSIVLLHRIATSWHGLSLSKRLDGAALCDISRTFAYACSEALKDWPKSMFKMNNVSKEQVESLLETCQELTAAIESAISSNGSRKHLSDSSAGLYPSLQGSNASIGGSANSVGQSGTSIDHLAGNHDRMSSINDLNGGNDAKLGNAIRSPRLRRRSSGRVNPIASPPMMVPTPAPNFEKLKNENWSLFSRQGGHALPISWPTRLKWLTAFGVLMTLLYMQRHCSPDDSAMPSLCRPTDLYGAPFRRIAQRWGDLTTYTGTLHFSTRVHPTLSAWAAKVSPALSSLPVEQGFSWVGSSLSSASHYTSKVSRGLFSVTPPVFQNKTIFLVDAAKGIYDQTRG